jgi:hypothetical protein
VGIPPNRWCRRGWLHQRGHSLCGGGCFGARGRSCARRRARCSHRPSHTNPAPSEFFISWSLQADGGLHRQIVVLVDVHPAGLFSVISMEYTTVPCMIKTDNFRLYASQNEITRREFLRLGDM